MTNLEPGKTSRTLRHRPTGALPQSGTLSGGSAASPDRPRGCPGRKRQFADLALQRPRPGTGEVRSKRAIWARVIPTRPGGHHLAIKEGNHGGCRRSPSPAPRWSTRTQSPRKQRPLLNAPWPPAPSSTPGQRSQSSLAAPSRSRKCSASPANPWNQNFDVGGSSGGAGASLAAGLTTLAGGSDIGGSIRIPASCTGVVGFKPPYGRVPQQPPFNLDHYCHEGPMTRTIADCALFENIITGPHPSIASLREQAEFPLEPSGVAGLRIAVSVDLGSWDVEADVKRNTLRAAEALRAAGATVEEVDFALTRKRSSGRPRPPGQYLRCQPGRIAG